MKTFARLCGKAIEFFSEKGDEKYIDYMQMMKKVLSLKEVDKLMKDDENEIKEFSDK